MEVDDNIYQIVGGPDRTLGWQLRTNPPIKHVTYNELI